MEIMEEINTKELVESFREKERENADICTVILKVNNAKFGIDKKTYDIKLFGKTMTEWVANAVFDTEIRYAECEFGDDFLPRVKNVFNPNAKYTVVLFSDTPLFEHKTFLQIMEYFKMKDLSVLKLTRGYVFETKYLMQIDSLLNPQMQYFEEEDFITCYSLKQVAIVREILKNRILNYFMKNGVVIEDPASTFIDADVQIAKNTHIEPFCKILGQSVIEDNVFIGSFSEINDSVICSGVKVFGAKITNSLVESHAKVERFSTISNNTKVCEEVVVPENCKLDGVVVKKEDKLKSFYSYVSKE